MLQTRLNKTWESEVVGKRYEAFEGRLFLQLHMGCNVTS